MFDLDACLNVVVFKDSTVLFVRKTINYVDRFTRFPF